MPSLITSGAENDDRISMFKGSNAYDLNAPGISARIAKGIDPFTSIDLNKASAQEKAAGFGAKKEEADPAAEEAKKEAKKDMPKTGDIPEFGKACGMEEEITDPKLKRHKKEFDKMRSLHENMDMTQRKSMRGERIAARLKKCIVAEIKNVIKSYGEENLIDTHGEQFLSDADKQVLDYVRSIERVDIDLSPTHNPAVPRSYSSGCKSMDYIHISQKAFE